LLPTPPLGDAVSFRYGQSTGCFLRSGRFQLGEGDELSVIAAAVLGGTSLFGGFGSVVGSIVGALMIGLINNGLILMGSNSASN
jgi:ribose/xylose/arabinose/galactoside ABC-type transport system permease subunit